MRYIQTKSKQTEEINIGPLIDLVFILLIFFAVSTTFVKDMKLEIERPSKSKALLTSTKVVRVRVTRGGQIMVDDQVVKSYMLQSRVRDMLSRTSSDKVLVVTDGKVAAGQLVDVVDQCKAGGASEIAVAESL